MTAASGTSSALWFNLGSARVRAGATKGVGGGTQRFYFRHLKKDPYPFNIFSQKAWQILVEVILNACR